MEELKQLLGDELYNQVTAKLGDKKLILDDVNFIPKSRFDEVNNEKNTYKTQLADRDKQLETLKTTVAGNETLTAEIERLKGENEKTKADYETKIQQMNFNSKLDSTLSGLKAKNSKAVKALLNMDNVKLDGENFLGLNEQIEALKKSDPYLFDVKDNAGGGGFNPPGAGSAEKNPWAKETFNLTEQGKIFKENPALAQQLMNAAGK